MAETRLTLDRLESAGAVLWYERLNSGKVRTEYNSYIQMCRIGTPDFIAILKGGYIYFIEAKSDTGSQSTAQLNFQRNVEKWATYEIVRDVKQIKNTVEKLTGFYGNKLKEIIF